MIFKRTVSGILVVLMCLAIAGCSDNGGDVKPSDDSTSTEEQLPRDAEPPKREVVESMGDLDLSAYNLGDGIDPDFSLKLEAEDGKLSGNAKVSDLKFLGDFTGSGFVTGITDADSMVEFEVEFPSSGSYQLILRAGGDGIGQKGSVSIDGSVVSAFTVDDNVRFFASTINGVYVEEGKHTLAVRYNTTSVHIDNIVIKAASPLDNSQYENIAPLTNPNANETTRRLYNFLTDTYGKYIISGNYAGEEGYVGGIDSKEFQTIGREFDDYPAIMGLDFMRLSPSSLNFGGYSDAVNHALKWDKMGGIVTFCWHWYPGEDYLNVNGEPWHAGFYTYATDFKLNEAMNGNDPKGYEYILRDIDAIAEYLKILEENDVPVLWRPLHEASGTWFWWGATGGDAYKKLWILMYDRLTNYHKINNLIWVWNAQDNDWYPGDEYVDMISYDVYAEAQDTSSQKSFYDMLRETTTGKIIALSENGVIPDPDQCFADGSTWSWFAVWNGTFTLNNAELAYEYTPAEIWEKVYRHERVLTLSELPDLKSYPLDTEAYLAAQSE